MNDNKLIAINTIVLTIKMVITLICNFIVSRFVLQALGADNFGLYNVVGGIVAMLTIVSTSMVATTNRFIVVEIGKGVAGNPQRIYSTVMVIHVALAVLLLIIGEPLGAFYINNYLNVTNASIEDAQFVFFFSLIAAFFTIVAVPSNGLLMAEEKFLPISIIDITRSLLNVVMAVFLLNYGGNRLQLYAVLMALLTIGNRAAFQLYCHYKYPAIVRFKFNKDKKDYKEIASFTGWILIGASAVVGKTQGIAMVINIFFRNSINAAFGVATQISHATSLFTNTLRQSVTPQIMKNQEVNSTRSLSLVYAISRYTFLIMLIICIPLLLCMDTILQFWLGKDNIPPFTVIFSIFMLINGMISNLGSGFDASIQASGKIRKNQIGYTIINLSIIPIVYVLYYVGLPAYINVVVALILTIVTLLFQASVMQEQTGFTYGDYWRKTLSPVLITSIVALLPMAGLRILIGDNNYIVLGFAVLSLIWSCSAVFFVGMNKHEQKGMIDFVNKMVLRK